MQIKVCFVLLFSAVVEQQVNGVYYISILQGCVFIWNLN